MPQNQVAGGSVSFVAYWSRGNLRTTWRSALALLVLIGLIGGTVLALVAGGLRTDSAYPRFAERYLGADATIYEYSSDPAMVGAMQRVVHLRQVAAYGQFEGYSERDGTTVGAPLGPGFEKTVGVPKLLSGRLPTASDEIALDWVVAGQHHLAVGDTYRLAVLSNTNRSAATYPMRVVGVVANTLNFPPYSTDGASGALLVTSSFIAVHEGVLGQPSVGIEVRLHGGEATYPAFNRAVLTLFPGRPVIVQGSAVETAAIEGAIHPAAVALWLLGGSLAVVALFVLYQLLARLSAMQGDRYTTASGLGASRRQLAGVELARSAAIAVGATALSVVTAVLLSPIFPLGSAGVAEPDPGVQANAAVLGLGAILIVLLTLGLAAIPTARSVRDATRVHSWQSGLSVPAPISTWSPRWLWLRPVAWMGVVQGLRSGRGTVSVPVRASLVSLVVAVTGLTGALTFGADLEHMLDTPALYGWSWDAHIYDAGNSGTAHLTAQLMADRWLQDVDLADTGVPLRISGHVVQGVDYEQEKGAVLFTMEDGRQPVGPDEIALSLPIMRELGAHLGGRVAVQVTAIEGPTRSMTVVGEQVGPATATSTEAAGAALMSRDALMAFVPPPDRVNVPPTGDAFVDFVPGADTPAHEAQLENQIGAEYRVYRAEPPTDILNFGRVQNLPVVLALLLTALAASTLFLTLMSSANRRRGDLAVLKTLGYRPRQLRAVVACQATAMAAIGLAVGIPLGIAFGRWMWLLVADHLGVLPDPLIPWWQIAVMAGSALVLANVAALWPARVAAGTPAAVLLHND